MLFIISASLVANAGRISGTIFDESGQPLGFASIYIKGTTKGTTANGQGKYFLNLEPGNYTIVCQYVGYQRQEKEVKIGTDNQVLDFVLPLQPSTLGEVVVKNGEDPAYEVIRQAIRKRDFYNKQVDSFMVDVYIKGLLRSRGLPKKIFGQKIELDSTDGIDSLGRGILFLSESVTRVSYKEPGKIKFEVLSSRQSGGGMGLSFPFFISFYQNNVTLLDNTVNKRGFVSPIAENALHYYRYKLEGTFFEDKKMINRIKVIPRRMNEPLFSGYINIVEDDWRIHSLELMTTKDYQLELLDTIKVTQTHVPVTPEVWRTKNQVTYLATKKFGFDFTGNFVNVYNDYVLNPGFNKKTFGRVFMKYDTAYNKKDSLYWDQVRPVPLEADEKQDYKFKDSLAVVERDSMFSKARLDSLRRNQKPVSVKDILWSGVQRNFYRQGYLGGYELKPLIPRLQYNSVEGLAIQALQRFRFLPRNSPNEFRIDWNTRYGFSNGHLNSYVDFLIRKKKESFRNRYWKFSGGKRLSQFNNEEPIDPLSNTAYTLFAKKNYAKYYENWFGAAEYHNRFENGLDWLVNLVYEDRLPVQNSTDFSFFNKDRVLLPNHPFELAGIPFAKHQALVAGITLRYQPGQRYIELPREKIPIGSKWPIFEFQYSKGIHKLAGSDVDFDKWKLSVYDNLNLKLKGEFRYKVSIGGFLNDNRVEIPDLQHFNGNQTFYNFKYLNSFQLAPYYRYSNSEAFYFVGHAEHHFNGLLTNKIPLFNKLKWNLVAGVNTFYVNKNNYYVEGFAGLENIFKIFRVDIVSAWQPGTGNSYGVRIGLGGIFDGRVRFSRD